jgi:hypothetical protein
MSGPRSSNRARHGPLTAKISVAADYLSAFGDAKGAAMEDTKNRLRFVDPMFLLAVIVLAGFAGFEIFVLMHSS